MDEGFLLCGYAVPFHKTAYVADGDFVEWVARGAFDDMLVAGRQVALQFDTHSRAPAIASTRDQTLTLFADGFGLGFEAYLDGTTENWATARSVVRSHNYASVNFTKTSRSDQRPASLGRMLVNQVDAAEIDHITLTYTPVYRDTAVWTGHDDLVGAPWRLQSAAEQWHAGMGPALKRIKVMRASRRSAQPRRCDPAFAAAADRIMAQHNAFMQKHFGGDQKYRQMQIQARGIW